MRKFENICALFIIALCISALVRKGFSIYPCLIIPLQVFVVVLNNREYLKQIFNKQ